MHVENLVVTFLLISSTELDSHFKVSAVDLFLQLVTSVLYSSTPRVMIIWYIPQIMFPVTCIEDVKTVPTCGVL